MLNVELYYNPYSVETKLAINGETENLKEGSMLSYLRGKRLQEWIDDNPGWPGIFDALKETYGEDRIKIDFIGTRDDYLDLQDALAKKRDTNSGIELYHANEKEAKNNSPVSKMLKLRELFKELQNGPVNEFKSKEIKDKFEEALNSEFKIIVVAPMSSGKSTLINSILGRDYLPALNQATTAVITRIKDNDNAKVFTVSAYDIYNKKLCDNRVLTKELIEELNYLIDPKDKDGKRPLLREIDIEGNLPNLESNVLQTVFIDTPGGNNSQNEEHEKIMEEAIRDEAHSLILYVLDGSHATTNDSCAILNKISMSMRQSNNGKLSRDRFLFVANKMDIYDVQKESYESAIENSLLPHLEEHGIFSPNLFLVSSQAAKLARMSMSGEKMTEDEEDNLFSFKRKFKRRNRSLIKYASLDAENKQALIDKAEEAAIRAESATDKATEDMYLVKSVELNSGLPALEKAISIYLEKYALAIKINAMHASFMNVVKERNMLSNLEQECANDEETWKEVISKLEHARKVLDDNKQKQVFKDSIKGIQIDYSPIKQARAKIVAKIQEISERCPEKLKKNEAEMELLKITESFKKIDEYVEKEMQEAFAKGALSNCITILQNYKDYIKELDKEGVLNIGQFDFKETTWFGEEDIDLISMMQKYSSIEKLQIGTKKEKEEGLVAAIKRLFGVGGYRTVKVYEDKEFILVKDLVTDVITECQDTFEKDIVNKQESIKNTLQELKLMIIRKMDKLEDEIRKQTAELEKILSNKEALDKKVEEDKEKYEWTKKFIEDVDSLLSIKE